MSAKSNAIQNAETIIERFGGIRPMAAKINVAVTTIQGWKKRGVIPAKRKDEIIQAAANHNIDLQDLIENTAPIANQNNEPLEVETIVETDTTIDNTEEEITQDQPEEKTSKEEQENNIEMAVEEAIAAIDETPKESKPSSPESDLETANNAIIQEALQAERASAKKVFVATLFIMVVGLSAVLLLLWPQNERVELTAQRLSAIEANVSAVKDEVTEIKNNGSFFGNLIPSDLENKIADLQEQAGAAQKQMGDVLKKAESFSNDVLSENAGTIEKRIEKLEQHASVFSTAAPELTDMVGRLSTLQSSVQGQMQLDQSVAELNSIVSTLVPNVGSIDEALGKSEAGAGTISLDDLLHTSLISAKDQSPALSQTFEGVPPENMKAAAILLGFSQFRSALNRDNKAFDSDLQLLSNLIGQDNPELQTAIQQLAPHAQNGVLSSSGLSNEFRSIAGDAVIASLNGQDISIQERAQARMNSLLTVEKNGEMVSGTPTQQTVSKAQKMLDSGDIQGAINTLQSLDGQAAQTTAPFIEQAQATLLAQQVEQMMGSSLNLNGLSALGIDANTIKSVIPALIETQQ